MIVELLPFNDEIDILQTRIRLMAGRIGRHVIAEGDLTHQGDPKPFHLDGIDLPATVHRVKATLPDGHGDTANWEREETQRDALTVGILTDPDTLILSCDVDEIVDPATLNSIYDACQHGPVSLGMRMIYYGTREDPGGWPAAKAFRARHTPRSLSKLRLSRCPIVPDCGWHLSYLGDIDRRRQKIEAFAHAEARDQIMWDRIAEARDGPNGEPLTDFDPDGLPKPLQRLITEVRP